nr:translation initiation factor IF-2-like [Rattus norvegicus]
MARGQRFTPPPPNLFAPQCPEVAPQPREPTPPGRLPAPPRPGPTPNPSGAPAPTHPGAGVGGCRVGIRSNRRGSSAPRTCWLRKARSLPSYLRRSQPQAPRPARARKLRPGAAEAQSAQQREEAPSRRRSGGSPRRRSLARPSFTRSVRASVRPWGCPSPAAAAATATAAPARAWQSVPSPPSRFALRLVSSGSLVPCPRRHRCRAERSPAGHGLPLPRRRWGRGAGGAERRVRGRRRGCALRSPPIPTGRAAPGRAPEHRAARQRRERGGGPGSLAAGGCPGRGRARGSDSARGCVCVCVCVCLARVSGGAAAGGRGD